MAKNSGTWRRCGRRALVLAIGMMLIALMTVPAAPRSAQAATYGAHIESVTDDQFVPAGYDWSVKFTDVEIESGWTYTNNLKQYYFFDDGDASNTLVSDGDDGYMIAVDANTRPGGQKLRLTGGEYGGNVIDAVITVTGWTYREPPDGMSWHDWLVEIGLDRSFVVDNFTPGVYYNPSWHPEGASAGGGSKMLNNFNFYTVGLSDLDVEIDFYKTGTTVPVDVSGHFTCIDLDVGQKAAFGGAINVVQVSQESLSSGHLLIEDGGDTIASSFLAIGDALVDPNYKLGLVSCYFDYGSESDPVFVRFVTSYQDAYATPISFFALTNEYVTAANPDDEEGTIETAKSADKTSDVVPGDIVTFTVDAAVHERGVNCRGDWYYTTFEIVDELPDELNYIEDSAYLTDEEGNRIDGAGGIAYDDQANTVTFAFDEDYLRNVMPMTGEHYLLVLQAEVADYPADGSMTVTNNALSRVNGSGTFPASPLDIELADPEPDVDPTKPAISIKKSAESDIAETDEEVAYVVVVSNVADVKAENVKVHDSLPDDLDYIEGSLECDVDDASSEVSGNMIAVTIPSLDVGESATITYRARLVESDNETIVNTAFAEADDAAEVSDSAEVTRTAESGTPHDDGGDPDGSDDPDTGVTRGAEGTLPQAGSSRNLVFPVMGGCLLVAAAAVVVLRRRAIARGKYLDRLP